MAKIEVDEKLYYSMLDVMAKLEPNKNVYYSMLDHIHLHARCPCCGELEVCRDGCSYTTDIMQQKYYELIKACEGRKTKFDSLDRIEAMYAFVERFVTCPSCEGMEYCLEDCTFEHDDPGEYDAMMEARYALFGD